MAITAAQLDVKFTSSGAEKVKGDLKGVDDAVNSANSGFNRFKNTMLGIGTALIAPVGIGLNMAIDLEQAMANVNASLGGVDTSVLSELEQGFMDIGAASQYSAVEVAAVGDEIARAGFATDTIVGMSRAVVDLSQATGADLMTSVAGVTSAMQTWSPAIVEADIALTDAARAADIFTVAANASSADVEDIIAGMRNFGPMAASMGIGFDEASAAVAMFTNYGMKAADSGTSLTRAIQNLNEVARTSPEILEELNIQAFDAQGNFVGLPSLFDQLNASLGHLDPQARDTALSLLFGAEAMDVMTIAAMTGGDPLRMIQAEMEGTGQAAEQSALRMNTLKAQFGELMESITNLLGRGMAFVTPMLRAAVDGANAFVDALSRIPQPIIATVGAVAALLAGIAAVTHAIRGFQALSAIFGGAGLFGGLSASAVAAPLLAIAAAVGVAYAAIRFNLGGIGDAIEAFRIQWEGMIQMRDPVSAFFSAMGAALRSFDIGILDTIGQKFEDVGNRIDGFLDGFKDAWDFVFGDSTTRDAEKNGKKQNAALGLLQRGYENLTGSADDAADPLSVLPGFMRRLIDPTADAGETVDETAGYVRDLTQAAELSAYPVTVFGRVLAVVGEAFRRADMPGIAAAFDTMARLVDTATGAFREFRDQGAGPVTSALLALGVAIPPLETAMAGLSAVTSNLGDAFLAALRGDWSQAFLDLREAAAGAWVVIGEIAGGIGGLVVDLVNWTINVGVPAVTGWIVDAASNAWGAISAAAGWAWDGLVALGAWTLNTAVPAITGWIADNAGNVWDALSTAAGWVWDGIVELGSWVLNVAVPQVVGSATAIWDAIKGWVIGETGGVLSLPNIAVTVTDWIITGGGELIAKLDEFIFGEAGDREFTIPVINVTVSRVNVLPFGDKIQEGIDTAVRVWQTAQEVHADIEEIRVRAGRARIDDSGGGGGFLDYLKGEIQAEIDHASATWDFIVDFSIVAHAEVRDEDSTYNQVVDLIGDMAGGWGMLHGGTVDWDFVLGEPEILGFGLIDAALWIDEHIYQPIKDAVDALKDKFTFDLPSISINWPDPPEVPGWLKQLFTDPAGWIKDQVGIGGGDEGTSGAGEVIGNFMSDLEFGAARATGAMLQAAAAVREAGDASEEASTQTSLLETAAQTASRGVYNFGVRFAEAMGLGLQPLMAMRSQVESLGRFLSVSLPPVEVQVTAETDMAMQGMSAVQNALAGLDGASATTYQLGDNAGALAAVTGAAGAVAGIDGMTALTHVNGDNANALGAVMGAAAAVGGIDGMTATTYINGVNNVGAAVADAWNALNSIDGATATAYVNVVSSGSGLGSRLGNHASGGYVRTPYQIVGERGPELVQLPYGSYVHTADETARILAHRDDGIAPPRSSGSRDGGGDTYYVNVRIDGNVIGNDDFADAVAEHTVWKIASTKQRRDLAKGVAA